MLPCLNKKIKVAIIGLGFGMEFIPIYQAHADANMYAICQRNEANMNMVGDALGIEKRYLNYYDVLDDPNVDFPAEANSLYELTEEPRKLDIIPGTSDHGSNLLSRDSLNASIEEWFLQYLPLIP